MTDDHWFDALNKALIRDAPRRTLLRTAAAVAAGLALGVAPVAEAAKNRKKKGKGKGKRKGTGTGQPNPAPSCSGGVCARVWAGDRAQIDYCEFICRQCDGDDPRQFCIIGGPGDPFAASCCDEGLTCCDGLCVDTRTDPDHCSGCGNACSPGKTCEEGSCSCREGLTRCGDICRDTFRDENHCGGCNQPCTGQGMRCCNGACIDTRFDNEHCGDCTPCPAGEECCHGICRNPQNVRCCRDHPPQTNALWVPYCQVSMVCCTTDGRQDCCRP